MYRTLDAAFWTDPKILKLTAHDRYVFLYLITNPHSHVSGIYYLPMGAANDETGLTGAAVNRCLDTLSGVGIVRRDTESSIVWVVNMMAYQGSSPKLATNVGKHLHSLHGSQLVGLFLEKYPAVQSYFDSHAIGGQKTRKKKIPNSLRYQVLERDGFTCQYCGAKPPDVAMEVDHVIPESADGPTELGNLKAACWACNNGKSDRVSAFATPNRTGTDTEQEQDQEQKQEIAAAPDLFDSFWATFPSGRKTGKGAARKSWAAAIRKCDPAAIIAAAYEYAQSPIADGDFVKQPATWLNQECWHDDREAWQRNGNATPSNGQARTVPMLPITDGSDR